MSLLGLSMWARSRRVREIRLLGQAIRTGDASPIGSIEAVNIISRGPGIKLELRGSRTAHVVAIDDESRQKLWDWLG